MKPRRPALPGASKAIRAIVAGPLLVAALCLAGAMAAFLLYPAYAQSGDEASAPSNLTPAIADGGVILNWSSPAQNAPSVTGYEILRRRPKEGEGALLVLVADTGSTATTYMDATANEPGVRYVYRVKALRGSEKSSRSNYARVDLPEEADETEPTPAPAPRGVTVQPSDAQSGDQCSDPAPTPTAVDVTAVPIVVESTTDDYFVLYVNHDVDGAEVEFPVLVKRGEAGTTTLAENIKALPASDYRVEKYAVADPADVDMDCLDDLADPSPLNHSHRLELDPEDGAMMIANHARFEELANAGTVKFVLVELNSSTPEIYFQNTEKYFLHTEFADHLGIDDGHIIWAPAEIKYDSNILLNGDEGVYYYTLEHDYTSSQIERIHTLLAANLPVVDHNLAYNPWWVYALPSDWVHVDNPRIPVVDEGIIFRDVNFSALNAGEGYGRLQVLEPDDRPNPRDIVLYETLPFELSRVAGIISTQPQTPLSHVNLRAKQDQIPNAFIRDALDNAEISSLVGLYVYYRVTENAFELREATKAEVYAYYEASRPTATQTPVRDLSVTEITALSDIGFDDWDAFGVKAANVAVLGTLGFPDGAVPDGFAVPFYFYDEFMKANDLYSRVSTMLADGDFQTDYDTQQAELKDLRDAIKDATTPDWIITALEEMHAEFSAGRSLRYRSSTNNEDLPGFSGAGLYDSKTQDPDETEEDGIDKSIKGVWASLWNYRAFVEREFYRIDHKKTAMGVLVHPNYTDEWVNGVAVSFDPLYDKAGHHYVNSQVGEDLVTNPEAYSLPEELLLKPDGSYTILHYSNLIESMRLLMSDSQLRQLRRHLDTIHDHFEALYNPAAGEPFAMEIEFKITSNNALAIKQARPWVFGGAAPPSPDSAGTVALQSTQPRVGVPLTAALADPDGSISNITWQWASSPNGNSNWATISGAASARYTPAVGDVGNYLRATASYTDGHGAGKSAQAVSANPVEDTSPPPPPPPPPPANTPPEFLTIERGQRVLDENTPAGEDIGRPVSAWDAQLDTITYILGGNDAGSFDMDASSGQLITKAALDYETKSTYRVIVWIHDGKDSNGAENNGTDASQDVTIRVTNVGEAGEITLSPEQPHIGTQLSAIVEDLDGSVSGEVWRWERSADMRGWISIAEALSASYTPVEADRGSYLRVTASYSDGHGSGKSAGIVSASTVVANTAPGFPLPELNEDGEPRDSLERMVAENADSGEDAGGPVAAVDPDGDALTYRLSGDDAASFDIDETTGQLSSRSVFDYEAKATYSVTVSVLDGKDTDGNPDTAIDDSTAVSVFIINEGEPGGLALSSARPRVGSPLVAVLTDPDGVVGEVKWVWRRSTNPTPVFDTGWQAISGANTSSYTPVEADLGYYLRVTAVYDDGHAPGRRSHVVSDAEVVEFPGPSFPEAKVNSGRAPGPSVVRSIAETAGAGEKVGDSVVAESPNGNVFTYTLSGEDAALFTIDASTGQVSIRDGTELDYESEKRSYTLLVTATDSSGAASTVTVVIQVSDVELTGIGLKYDANNNNNKVIDREEAVEAVSDYFRGLITKEETIEVIRLYFTG